MSLVLPTQPLSLPWQRQSSHPSLPFVGPWSVAGCTTSSGSQVDVAWLPCLSGPRLQAGKVWLGLPMGWVSGRSTASVHAQLSPGRKEPEKTAYWPAASAPCSPWSDTVGGVRTPSAGPLPSLSTRPAPEADLFSGSLACDGHTCPAQVCPARASPLQPALSSP